MKKIIAYVNTLRVHPLVEALGKSGIRQMVVTEYFTPYSRISRFIFLCDEQSIESTREIVRRIGTSGSPSDHFFEVQDFDPAASDASLSGPLIHRLEEEEIV
ncbi:MAG TPA: hypothetical protein VI932_10055 [Bacteroidota bacterium]|nr:hypothetical protein [Bacteroidota bacterium]